MRRVVLLVLLSSIGCTEAAPPRPPSVVETGADEVARERVREEIRFAWKAYEDFAFGDDELRPISQTGSNWHGDVSLGLTIVDALDTLHLAGLDAERDRALVWIRDELSFDVDARVSVFETNIRILGGLLSGYALLEDPMLLEKAVDLGDRLLVAFDSPSGIPYRFVHLRDRVASEPDVDTAEAGTYLLELEALSRFTGDPKYREAARRAADALDATRYEDTGLIASGVQVERGEPTLPISQIGGGVDSYVEYLWKGALQTGDRALADRYRNTVEPLHEYASFEIEGRLFYGWVDGRNGRLLAPMGGALDCFFPGLLALEGDLPRARASLEGCWAMHERFGLLPDSFEIESERVIAPNHELRPELAESLFYLHRFTGEAIYRARGLEILDTLATKCRVEHGYAVLSDVRTDAQGDGMPSFFLAETLKYLFLLFEDHTVLPLDEWVFNTEAHPFPITPR